MPLKPSGKPWEGLFWCYSQRLTTCEIMLQQSKSGPRPECRLGRPILYHAEHVTALPHNRNRAVSLLGSHKAQEANRTGVRYARKSIQPSDQGQLPCRIFLEPVSLACACRYLTLSSPTTDCSQFFLLLGTEPIMSGTAGLQCPHSGSFPDLGPNRDSLGHSSSYKTARASR